MAQTGYKWSVALDVAFKIAGLAVFLRQGLLEGLVLEGKPSSIALVCSVILMGFGEFILPMGVFDAISRKRKDKEGE